MSPVTFAFGVLLILKVVGIGAIEWRQVAAVLFFDIALRLLVLAWVVKIQAANRAWIEKNLGRGGPKMPE